MAIVFLDAACDVEAIRRTISRIRSILDLPMIRVGGDADPRSIGLPADVSADVLLATLRGLAHRVPEIRRLQSEIDATIQVAEGVRAEIASIDEELRAASMVQREFLPREMPEIDGALALGSLAFILGFIGTVLGGVALTKIKRMSGGKYSNNIV